MAILQSLLTFETIFCQLVYLYLHNKYMQAEPEWMSRKQLLLLLLRHIYLKYHITQPYIGMWDCKECFYFLCQTDMFYSLQQQMANMLHVDADLIGLFLNDRHLAATDTPQSTRLHLADIIGVQHLQRQPWSFTGCFQDFRGGPVEFFRVFSRLYGWSY